ncbi:MAG TPA: family 20 glycosylhydrolase [Opitutaceae bacterium]|nr:family 20 glycosylhydrolase [Opitutaceae bacterium]
MIPAFQWDLARQVERVDWLQAQLPRYADWGYRELYLHLEDAVEFPSLPGVARRDAYSRRQFARLVGEAARVGIGVVPIVNLLGHTQYLIKVPELRDLNELRAPDGSPLERGQVCPVHPRILDVADALIRDVAPFCTAGKVHVGLDESFDLGRHPSSIAEIGEIGVAGHFGRYVRRLSGVAGAHRLRLGLWADMLALLPGAVAHLPPGTIAYDWYYYPFGRLPRIELRNFAEYDLAPALKARGIEYWGCPMNGSFRHEPLPVFGERLANIRSWWRRCSAVGAGGFLVTSWEPNRLAIETTTVVDAAAASLWLKPGADGAAAMLAGGLERVYGLRHPHALAARLLAGDRHAFCGYARWQMNERWDAFAGRESLEPYRAGQRFFRRLSTIGMPAAFAASVAFRRYLADRDVFVRKAARDVFQLRRLLRRGAAREAAGKLASMRREAAAFRSALGPGRRAARAMWNRSRDRRAPAPNEAVLHADAGRLARWLDWLRRAVRRPDVIRRATPVCGAWQLRFWVHNFAPALQRVVVEEQRPDGAWRELGSRYLIEFRARAARPRARIRREFTVPVASAGTVLRLAVRGVGQAAVSHVEVTDGWQTLRQRNWRTRIVLGTRAPMRGLPRLDWT